MASIAIDVLLSGIRDTSGNPLAAGLVYTYEPGTTTPRALYTDSGLITPAANPVVLDAYGMATVYANNTYKFVVKTSGGTTLYTWDNLNFQAPADDDFPNGGNAGGANRTMGNTDNYSLGLLTNNSNRLHITNAGDVGIGTTSPAFQLHVVDNSATLAGAKLEASQNNVPTALDLYGNGNNANERNWRVQANSTTGSFTISRSTTSSGAPSTATIDITSGGKVGIGTATPAVELEVRGSDPYLTVGGSESSGVHNVGVRLANASTNIFTIGGAYIGGATVVDMNVVASWGTTLSVGGTEYVRLSSAGNLGVGTTTPSAKVAINGGLHVGGDSDPGDNNCTVDGIVTVGTGVKFPATQSPSADANCLDDYEEGTWTPALAFETGQVGSFTYVSQTGNYTKIGRLVFFDLRIYWSAIPSAGSTLRITGLPFSTSSSPACYSTFGTPFSTVATGTWATSSPNLAAADQNSNVIALRRLGTGSPSSYNQADIPTNADIWLSGSFITS